MKTTFEKLTEHLLCWKPTAEDLAPSGVTIEELGSVYGRSIDFLCAQIDERDREIADLSRRMVNLVQRCL